MNEQEKRDFENMKQKLKEMEDLLKTHRHNQLDKTQMIDGDVRLKPGRVIAIGETYQVGAKLNENTASEVNRFLWSTGEDNSTDTTGPSGMTTTNSQLNLEHQQNYKWKGNWVTSTAYEVGDAVRNSSQHWICYNRHTSGAASEPGVGGSYTTYWTTLDLYTFYYAFRPPLHIGADISVTSGGATLTDTSKRFGVNELAGTYLNVYSSSFTNAFETHLISSNTATVITIADTFGANATADYAVWNHVFLGAADWPWRRLYTQEIRLGFGPSAGSGVRWIKFGSGSPENVITAGIGSIYLRTDGGAGTSFYVKESGSSNTGWVGK